MKNITLSIDDEVYRSARMKAAERNMSLSSLVRNYLQTLADASKHSDLKQDLFASMDNIQGVSASRRLSREQANDRAFCR
jgi:predicted CopG family antitoxin